MAGPSRRLAQVPVRYASRVSTPATPAAAAGVARTGLKAIAFHFGQALRETGQALDRVGCIVQGNMAFKEQLNRSRRLMPLFDVSPQLDPATVFVAPNATVIGNVSIGFRSSVWYGCVLRGDVNSIEVGKQTVIGDATVVHVVGAGGEKPRKTVIGDNVIVGSGCVIHGCTLHDGCVIGLGATVSDGAVVEAGAVVDAGALVAPDTVVKTKQLWAGSPARYVRDLTEAEVAANAERVTAWADLAEMHRKEHARPEWDRERERDSIYYEEMPILKRKMEQELAEKEKNYEP
eukprot:CAMPEP_0177653390 /NCGR_PEP_ID=MMETSP0447-20121125/13710_1 /TAXON_ID=0 /ORGANISM="Stygamoeba regulata, Strain BSH-02190019" /LENGTH=289 /DNA_ID=CAMNT_0019156843 /DNA_START=46 /DNA_END=915 /DNA_ORIENTATION=+